MDPQARAKYCSFISFRGADTRENIVSHLQRALNQQGIKTFNDNTLDRGEEISPAVLRSIQESLVSIVIFSNNYAASPWCLDELVQIMECKRRQNQIVIPVFYHVDPNDVDNLTGSFGEALAYHQRYHKDIKKVQKWISALREAANLSGWNSNNTRFEIKRGAILHFHMTEYFCDFVRPDSTLVEEIVKDISRKLWLEYSYGASSSLGMQKWQRGLEEHTKQLMLHNQAVEMHLEQERRYLQAVADHAKMLEEMEKQRKRQ